MARRKGPTLTQRVGLLEHYVERLQEQAERHGRKLEELDSRLHDVERALEGNRLMGQALPGAVEAGERPPGPPAPLNKEGRAYERTEPRTVIGPWEATPPAASTAAGPGETWAPAAYERVDPPIASTAAPAPPGPAEAAGAEAPAPSTAVPASPAPGLMPIAAAVPATEPPASSMASPAPPAPGIMPTAAAVPAAEPPARPVASPVSPAPVAASAPAGCELDRRIAPPPAVALPEAAPHATADEWRREVDPLDVAELHYELAFHRRLRAVGGRREQGAGSRG